MIENVVFAHSFMKSMSNEASKIFILKPMFRAGAEPAEVWLKNKMYLKEKAVSLKIEQDGFFIWMKKGYYIFIILKLTSF